MQSTEQFDEGSGEDRTPLEPVSDFNRGADARLRGLTLDHSETPEWRYGWLDVDRNWGNLRPYTTRRLATAEAR